MDIYDTIIARIFEQGENIDPHEVLEAVADIVNNKAGDIRDGQRISCIATVLYIYKEQCV